MTSEWVVGSDGSPGSEVAFRWAAGQAAGRDVALRVVSVWNVPVAAADIGGGPAVFVDWAEAESAVRDRIAELVDRVPHRGTEVVTEVVQGGAAAALIDAAAGSDLLVVGSRGLGGFRRLVLGSVSRQVATHATVPAVVVPHTSSGAPARRIVVGVDGSPNSAAALQWALDFADPAADLTVVGACEIAPWTDPAEIRRRFPAEVEAHEHQFQELVDRIDPGGLARRRLMLCGARQALAEASAGADLVVLGARGHGAVGAALLGSVTTWMLHSTSTPTVVVPHTEEHTKPSA